MIIEMNENQVDFYAHSLTCGCSIFSFLKDTFNVLDFEYGFNLQLIESPCNSEKASNNLSNRWDYIYLCLNKWDERFELLKVDSKEPHETHYQYYWTPGITDQYLRTSHNRDRYARAIHYKVTDGNGYISDKGKPIKFRTLKDAFLAATEENKIRRFFIMGEAVRFEELENFPPYLLIDLSLVGDRASLSLPAAKAQILESIRAEKDFREKMKMDEIEASRFMLFLTGIYGVKIALGTEINRIDFHNRKRVKK